MSLIIEKQRRYLLLISGVVFLIIAAGLLAYSLSGLWQRHEATNNPRPTAASAQPVTKSTDEPDETPPTANCSNYTTVDAQPQKIEIPSINVSGCIQQVDLDENNAVAVPTNIHLAGWFVRSTPPGGKGVSLIDGHVLGRYNDAIFGRLSTIKPGDDIKIQRRDGTWLNFQVVDIAAYPASDAAKHMLEPLPNIDKQLTLITCTGTYSQETETYDKRTIVRAHLK